MLTFVIGFCCGILFCFLLTMARAYRAAKRGKVDEFVRSERRQKGESESKGTARNRRVHIRMRL